MCAERVVQPDLSDKLVELIPRMRRFAAGLSGGADAGDELVQLACERLLRKQATLRPDTRLDSWLYRVIRNLHIDGIRARAARERNLHEVAYVAQLGREADDTLDKVVQVNEVEKAMRDLSAEHRAVLMLVCVEGLSYREASEVLEVPMGTVTSRLVRARGALIEKLAQGGCDSVGDAG